MKLRLLTVVAGLMAVTAWAAESVPLTFNAVLTVGKEHRFGVASAGGARTAWLTVGGEFEGYKIRSYDAQTQILTVERGGQTFQLPIASGAVQTLTAKTSTVDATLADAATVVTKIKFEQMLTRTIEQQKQAMAGISKQMLGQMAGQVSPEEFSALQNKIVDALWSEMKVEELKTDVTRIYADLFTKDELKGMSEFYATPAGEALVDKQPEMQQKMMESMMPRMMKAMPRIQQMVQEFAAQHSPKAVPAPAPKS